MILETVLKHSIKSLSARHHHYRVPLEEQIQVVVGIFPVIQEPWVQDQVGPGRS
ncbi:MAG: hypothetical protein RBG13Loki_2724 [Promethearchaeota archaeon CR_4]|nr:MAG: hypothetical protein RBG13Loki_2724 [Candidatus Lokiarchaeota archaeon CR_4]